MLIEPSPQRHVFDTLPPSSHGVSQVAEMWQGSGPVTNPAMQALNLIE